MKVKNTSKKSTSSDGIMPKGKASSALTNLLSNSSPSKTAKKSEPTMLEQLMSGKSITKQESPRGMLSLTLFMFLSLENISLQYDFLKVKWSSPNFAMNIERI